MITRTTLTVNMPNKICHLSRFINRHAIHVEFPLDVHATTLESYFSLTDEQFYELRTRNIPNHIIVDSLLTGLGV